MSILIKFRQHRIELMADITKAFLQISLNEMDRSILRFLWKSDFPMTNEEIMMYTEKDESSVWSIRMPIPFSSHNQTPSEQV